MTPLQHSKEEKQNLECSLKEDSNVVFGIITFDDNASNGMADLTLRCDADHNGPWNCEVEASLVQQHVNGYYYTYFAERRYCFNEKGCLWKQDRFDYWSGLANKLYIIDDKSTFELRISIISSEGGQAIADLTLFETPNRMSNVILKIGEKKLHVSKEILALHSPVFETLFFGNFSENGKEEVEIKNVVYEEFLDLLQLLYVKRVKITDRTVSHILKLSDQFQMENTLDLSKEYLADSKEFGTMKKLHLADEYRLGSLKEHCLKSFTSATQVFEELTSSPVYAKLSNDMKAAICDRMVQLRQ